MIKNFANLTKSSSDLGQAILRRGKASQVQAKIKNPGITSEQVYAREDKYGAHNYHPLPVALCRGQGK